MNNNEEIMSIIVNRRKELGLSLSEVARRLDIPKSTLSRYENLQRQFPLELVYNMSKVIDIDSRKILGLDYRDNQTTTIKSPIISEIVELMQKLDETSQANVLNFVKFEYAQAETAAKNKDDRNTAS